MVATSMHYIVGILIAWMMGYRDHRKYLVGLIAIIPDLDGIVLGVLMLGKQLFGYSLAVLETSSTLAMLFAHRGMSHSLVLLGGVLLVLVFLQVRKKMLLGVTLLWLSHLFLDCITAWKSFPLLPFSYTPHYWGLVEVFDPLLVLFTTVLFMLFLGESLHNKEKRWPAILALFIVFFFGFVLSIRMGEFSMPALVLTQTLFWVGLLSLHIARKEVKGEWFLRVGLVILLYICILGIVKFDYALSLHVPYSSLEPLESFTFDYHAHSFEVDHGEYYHIGIVNLLAVEQQAGVPKIINEHGVPEEDITAFLTAYEQALHINWINNPVWEFYTEDNQTFARVRYAKSFLNTTALPGPEYLTVTMQEGKLVSVRSWFA